MSADEIAAIRPATAANVIAMLPLIRAHARFERTAATARAEALQAALSGPSPMLHAWMAMTEAIVGYATATIDYSTFDGSRFVQLDCLFVRDDHRGAGIGARLLATVRAHAAGAGIGALQWQTPAWNDDAARFYRRSGANASPKLRFTLPLGRALERVEPHNLGEQDGT